MQDGFGTALKDMLSQLASRQCAKVGLWWGFPQPEAYKDRESHSQMKCPQLADAHFGQ